MTTIGELFDALVPDVWMPLPQVPGWRIKRLGTPPDLRPGGGGGKVPPAGPQVEPSLPEHNKEPRR